ncbi:hypothetical protein B0T22DRAFT_375879 [Podospora appendiculata]|uniref:NmrA-like domain-containing protein n=1 Tax=Podospora appendiculata TaxID=314037 RepID=A0AAE0XAN3_9PEZI|nr:hypothetical protein B0T22DRAFT_375879 [Podospora appendiculata]
MIKVAIAGGSGDLAHHVVDALLERNHEVVILSRRDPKPDDLIEGITWLKVNYLDKNDLVKALQGVHTVISFILAHLDTKAEAQINLIDACINAGVKRHAPSEWLGPNLSLSPFYASKLIVRAYLDEINKDKKVLEYTRFQPGLFLDYLASPYRTAKHITPATTVIDFEHRRGLVADGVTHDAITYTAVRDIAAVVARAVEYEGEWPRIGGIRGNTVSAAQLVALGEKIRGGKFEIAKEQLEDLNTFTIKNTAFVPPINHPSLSKDEIAIASLSFSVVTLLTGAVRGWSVSDEWNRLLPDYKFAEIGAFLTEAWAGKP